MSTNIAQARLPDGLCPILSSNTSREDIRFIDIQAHFEETAEELFRGFLFDGLDQEDALTAVLGRFKQVIGSASGPGFDAAGYISAIQVCTEAEVLRWFGFTTRRGELINRIRKWTGLAKAVQARRFLLDGSFVTQKSEPGDVDAVVLLPDDFAISFAPARPKRLSYIKCFSRVNRRNFLLQKTTRTGGDGLVFSAGRGEANGRYKGLIEVAL